jgi:hypothetical protein
MALDPDQFPRVLTVYLELTRYPILAERIRERMRHELFQRGVISREVFENEVREKARESQAREGLTDPLAQESPDVWDQRLWITRQQLTDFYFAYNLPHDLLEGLVRQTLADRMPAEDVLLTFHPELAPWDMLFAQGEAYEALPQPERARLEHHLHEIKVVLIKAMISDHLSYVGIARRWFEMADLRAIRARRFGRGKIGGKAAGMLLAEKILRQSAPPDVRLSLRLPASWFLGADVFRQFVQMNGLVRFANQKYKDHEAMLADYPEVRALALTGEVPAEIVEGMRQILDQSAGAPLIVRSSSLLEDSFGTSFAGKYESHFCPNQGRASENLSALLDAIRSIYASVYSPDVLLYRRRMGLVDYDERMAVLIQQVQGRRQRGFLLPDAAGVAYSRNAFRWSPQIRRQDGFARLVWGLGTRAVDQIGGDYARLVALSHPASRPEADPVRIRRYSQQQVDVIDLAANAFRTLPVADILSADTPYLRYLAQRFEEGTLADIVSLPLGLEPDQLTLTFDGLLRRTPFPVLLRDALQTLEHAYGVPVDVEFVLQLEGEDGTSPAPYLHLVQCRPQNQEDPVSVPAPAEIPDEDRLLVAQGMMPDGKVSGIRYLVLIPPQAYAALQPDADRLRLAQVIGRLNRRLAGETFMLLGPGRWGSTHPELGIPVTYADIYNTRALVELSADVTAPEPSYGTHFFHDLLEARIYPLAVALQDPATHFGAEFFSSADNALSSLLPDDASWAGIIQVIDLEHTSAARRASLALDGERGTAVLYLPAAIP